jgi:hypothetical protein
MSGRGRSPLDSVLEGAEPPRQASPEGGGSRDPPSHPGVREGGAPEDLPPGLAWGPMEPPRDGSIVWSVGIEL